MSSVQHVGRRNDYNITIIKHIIFRGYKSFVNLFFHYYYHYFWASLLL